MRIRRTKIKQLIKLSFSLNNRKLCFPLSKINNGDKIALRQLTRLSVWPFPGEKPGGQKKYLHGYRKHISHDKTSIRYFASVCQGEKPERQVKSDRKNGKFGAKGDICEKGVKNAQRGREARNRDRNDGLHNLFVAGLCRWEKSKRNTCNRTKSMYNTRQRE